MGLFIVEYKYHTPNKDEDVKILLGVFSSLELAQKYWDDMVELDDCDASITEVEVDKPLWIGETDLPHNWELSSGRTWNKNGSGWHLTNQPGPEPGLLYFKP